MSKIRLVIITSIAVIAFTYTGISQETATPKNNIHLTGGFLGLGAGAGLSYERTIFSHPERSFLRQINGRASLGVWNVWDTSGKAAILAITGLTGRSTHRLETMVGLAAAKNDELELNTADIIPAISIGYRRQKQEGGFLFRAGVGTPEGIYVGIGVAF